MNMMRIKRLTSILLVIALVGSMMLQCFADDSLGSSSGAGTILNVNTLSMKVGDTFKLDAGTNTVNWSSSNVAVAAVGNDGTVAAIGEGTATITATVAGSNTSDTCGVVVGAMSPVNVALNKTATAHNTANGQSPANAVNGIVLEPSQWELTTKPDIPTAWWPSNTYRSVPQWVAVDLGQAYDISSWAVTSDKRPKNYTSLLKDFALQYKDSESLLQANYTTTSWSTLQAAQSDAIAYRSSTVSPTPDTYTFAGYQTSINGKWTAILNALEGLTLDPATVATVNKDVLNVAINMTKNLRPTETLYNGETSNTTVDDPGFTDYNTLTIPVFDANQWALMQTALDAAKATAANESALQADVDSAADGLLTAISQLNPQPQNQESNKNTTNSVTTNLVMANWYALNEAIEAVNGWITVDTVFDNRYKKPADAKPAAGTDPAVEDAYRLETNVKVARTLAEPVKAENFRLYIINPNGDDNAWTKRQAFVDELELYGQPDNSKPYWSVTSVTTPQAIQVNTGTAKESLGLPETVGVTLNGTTTVNLPVVWNTESYNANVNGTYTFDGTLSLPSSPAYPGGIANDNSLKTSITVNVAEDNTTPGGIDVGTVPNYQPDWNEISGLLDQFVGVYNTPPARETVDRQPDGPLMGNSTVFAFLSGDTNEQRIHINHADMWERESSRMGYYTLGGINIDRIDTGTNVSGLPYELDEDMKNAEVMGRSAKGFRTNSYVAATKNVMMTNITNETTDPMTLQVTLSSTVSTVEAPHTTVNNAGVDTTNNIIYAGKTSTPTTVSPDQPMTLDFTMATRLLGKTLDSITNIDNTSSQLTFTLDAGRICADDHSRRGRQGKR